MGFGEIIMGFGDIRDRISKDFYSDGYTFGSDLINAIKEELGISTEVACLIFHQAWCEGHSAGRSEVLNLAITYTEMVRRFLALSE